MNPLKNFGKPGTLGQLRSMLIGTVMVCTQETELGKDFIVQKILKKKLKLQKVKKKEQGKNFLINCRTKSFKLLLLS
ncbi:hypothetical protein HYX13_05265 [Candidatus Woesearchaeota archaeon]|nr:hypothetical protein [Candidatus Woesearchaeota archaeon]